MGMKAKGNDILTRYDHIIFGREHYNPLGIARSLGREGIKPIGIIIKKDPPITSKSKYFKKVHIVNTIEEGYDILINHYRHNMKNKPFIYGSDDRITSFLDERYDELKDWFYFYNAGKTGRISFYMDKYHICELAKENGISFAETWVVEKGEIPEKISYPVITKAIKTNFENWKADSFICRNEEELREAYTHIKSSTIIIQKYIQKKNELVLEGCAFNKGRDVFIAIESKYTYILPDRFSSMMRVRNFSNHELREKLGRMFEKIGFEGIFEIEFLVGEDNEELFFLEINFRNSTWSYAATVAGMPLPIIWAKGMLGIKGEKDLKCIKKPFYAMAEVSDYQARVKSGKIHMWRWIFDFLRCKCRYYFSIKDILPFISAMSPKFKSRRK